MSRVSFGTVTLREFRKDDFPSRTELDDKIVSEKERRPRTVSQTSKLPRSSSLSNLPRIPLEQATSIQLTESTGSRTKKTIVEPNSLRNSTNFSTVDLARMTNLRGTFMNKQISDYNRTTEKLQTLNEKRRGRDVYFPKTERTAIRKETENSFTAALHNQTREITGADSRKIVHMQRVDTEDALFQDAFYWYYKNEKKSSLPSSREGATLTRVKDSLVLYGGQSYELSSELMIFSPQKKYWEKPYQSGDVPNFGRRDHTAVEYNQKVFIFGGETYYHHREEKIRLCLNDLKMFDLAKYRWQSITAKGQEIIKGRRGHAASAIREKMLVFGGFDDDFQILNDFCILDLGN